MEKCSVCACADEEIPKKWMTAYTQTMDKHDDDAHTPPTSPRNGNNNENGNGNSNNMGWISPEYGSVNSNYGLETIVRNSSKYITYHKSSNGNGNGGKKKLKKSLGRIAFNTIHDGMNSLPCSLCLC
jgi:hypothetical protein